VDLDDAVVSDGDGVDLWPAYLTNFLLRATMHRTQRCFLASGCSTYCTYALRAPQVENPTGHGTSPPSRRNRVRYAGQLLGLNIAVKPMTSGSSSERAVVN